MAEDRKKVLQALAAKRKAEAEGGGRKHKSSPFLSKPASAQKSSPLPHKSSAKPSPLLQQQKQKHHKKEIPPKKKKKRVENYDTEDEEDDSDEVSDSEDKRVKKKVPPRSATKTTSLKPCSQDSKGKAVAKEAPKGKRKSKDSSDDDASSGDEDEEAAEADSGDEGLDTTNIIQSRTRMRSTQPVHYETYEDDDTD